MIFFDVTKTGSASHRSGLTRVSKRLREELGTRATEISWHDRSGSFRDPSGAQPGASDWVFTSELFSEEERPGLTAFLDTRSSRTAALFHDAIPLKHPHITWPQSVARHPGYMKSLARFDRLWAVSQASRDELIGFWDWAGIERQPPVDVLPLGADFDGTPRHTITPAATAAPAKLLVVGILEPRKNQTFLLEVCRELWTEGLQFELHIVGRVNPHFGKPVVAQINELRRQFPAALLLHEAASDAAVTQLYGEAYATVFPTIAEGCGLPLLESLWRGVPCICSDLPVLQENARSGGCLAVPVSDSGAWQATLRQIVTDSALRTRLRGEAVSRPLPTWAAAAAILAKALAA